jgi:hypothetical protein
MYLFRDIFCTLLMPTLVGPFNQFGDEKEKEI